MQYTVLAASLVGLAFSGLAQAAQPKLVTDIAPVHSLAAQVMAGVAEPTLLIPAEASPHEYSLKPSQAKALADADLVIWTSASLTPWLEKSLPKLAEDAKIVELMALQETTTHEFREGARFETHDHHDDDHHEDEQHEDEHHDEHHHDHSGLDPHGWLDPENAKVWVTAIQQAMSDADPGNASTYEQNAKEALANLDRLIDSTEESLKPYQDLQFIVFHDAYQYFEQRFGISAAGAIALGDASDPSPARIKEIRDTVQELNVSCVFSEPQYNPGLVKTVFEDSRVSGIALMDPLGAQLSPGPGLYDELIEGLVSSLQSCAG